METLFTAHADGGELGSSDDNYEISSFDMRVNLASGLYFSKLCSVYKPTNKPPCAG